MAASRLAPQIVSAPGTRELAPTPGRVCLLRVAVNIYHPRYSPDPEKGMGSGRQDAELGPSLEGPGPTRGQAGKREKDQETVA